MRAHLPAPDGFSLAATVTSHGWFDLPPFEWQAESQRLATVVALPGGGAAPLVCSPADGGVLVEAPGRRSAFLLSAARRMFRLELGLDGFHAAASANGFGWIAAEGAGRLLAAPTPFEDVAKLVLTTNCSWAFTRQMTRALCELYGDVAPDGRRAFPRAEAIAAAGAAELRRRARLGYRAPLLARLAERVVAGEPSLERLERGEGAAEDLRRELLDLPGVGPYVAENLLRMAGRPAGLGLDSWLRSKYARVYHEGRRVTDRTIARRYARMGRWAGLALWCDMTRDWELT